MKSLSSISETHARAKLFAYAAETIRIYVTKIIQGFCQWWYHHLMTSATT